MPLTNRQKEWARAFEAVRKCRIDDQNEEAAQAVLIRTQVLIEQDKKRRIQEQSAKKWADWAQSLPVSIRERRR